jgi:hypothetical protein
MNRKTLTAVAAFAILGLIAFFALRQPEKGEGVNDRARPLPPIAAGTLDSISITRQGVTSTITRAAGKYKVTAPVAGEADESNAKGAFDALEKLVLGNLVTENKAKHAEFELDDAKAIHVVAKAGAATPADLLVGKSVGSGTMVRLAGKDEVWQATGPLRATFDKPPAEWRDRSVITFSTADAETLTVKSGTPAGMIVVKKNGKTPLGEDKWDLVSSSVKMDRLDNGVPNGIVSALSAFKTNDFADGATTAGTGLDTPSLTVTVGLKGGKNATLLVGNKKANDELYVKTPESPQIYVVKTFNSDHIVKRPIDFKDKTLADVGEADLKEVAVTHGADSYTLVHEGTTWKATKPPKFALDPGRTPAIGGGFKDWKATAIADNVTPATTGLAKPKATIVVKSMKGDTITFKVGEDAPDKQNVYLSSSKSPDVYLAPKWSTDRLLPKLDDLKKK